MSVFLKGHVEPEFTELLWLYYFPTLTPVQLTYLIIIQINFYDLSLF